MLGLSPLDWILVVWVFTTGVLGVLLLFRRLMTVSGKDFEFFGEAERNASVQYVRLLTGITRGFGIASLGLLAAALALWAWQALR